MCRIMNEEAIMERRPMDFTIISSEGYWAIMILIVVVSKVLFRFEFAPVSNGHGMISGDLLGS